MARAKAKTASNSNALVLLAPPARRVAAKLPAVRGGKLQKRAEKIATVILQHPNPAWKGYLRDVLKGGIANSSEYTPSAMGMHLSKYLRKHVPDLVETDSGRPLDALATTSRREQTSGRGRAKIVEGYATGYEPTKLGQAVLASLQGQGFFRKARQSARRKAA